MNDIVHPSQCWECNAYCGSLITMRDGKVVKIGPNPKHPGSKGAFCVKGVRAVLHTATLHKPHVATHSMQDFVDTNITGTLNLLEAAIAEVRAEASHPEKTVPSKNATQPSWLKNAKKEIF